jgi:hypothetical protein
MMKASTLYNTLRRTRPRGEAARIVLTRQNGTMTEVVFDGWEAPSSEDVEWDLETTCADVLQCAVDDVAVSCRRTTFTVAWVVGDDARATVAVKVEPAEYDGPVRESADAPGLLGQMMRHQEATTRLLIASQQQTHNGYERVIAMLTKQLEAKDKTIEVAYAALNKRAEIDGELEDAEEQARRTESWAKGMELAKEIATLAMKPAESASAKAPEPEVH